MNGGSVVADALERHDVGLLYTLCGGHISPILVEAQRSGVRIVDVRHEATAVFAADATSRLTGGVGVAAVTAGPGVTNTLTAVRNATVAESPLVLLGGAAPMLLAGRGALQDIDQQELMRPHVKWSVRVDCVARIGPALDEAFARARSGVPGPVFVELPVDVLYQEELVRRWYDRGGREAGRSLAGKIVRRWINRKLDRIFAQSRPGTWNPQRENAEHVSAGKLDRVARLVRSSRRPLLLLGSQVVRRVNELNRIRNAIEYLGVPAYASGSARGLLGGAHELLLRHGRRDALKAADLVILAGVPCDFRLNYGLQINHAARMIAVNMNRNSLSMNRKPDVGIHGDPGQALIQMAATGIPDREAWASWLQELREHDLRRDAAIDRSGAGSDLVNPTRLLSRIDAMLDERDVIVVDGGDFAATAAYITRPRRPLGWLDAGPFGTLGAGAGFALAARLVNPDSRVWLLYGDGSCGFSVVEFDTFVRQKVPVIAVVGNDGAWSQIARGQKEMLGEDVATVLERSDYHRVAQGLGGDGFLLSRDDETDAVLESACRAARAGRPVLINALIARSDFRAGSMSM